MAEETPKKIVSESWKCFTCSSPCSGNQRIYIFGSSSHNFAEIIKSSLNVDVKSYATDDTNNKLFVCKAVCYNRLLKFQRAVEKVNEVKKEIQAAFQTRPRAKRLLRPPDGEETRENQSSPSNRSKASRTLQFSSNNASTTCASSSYSSSASYSGSQLLAGVNPMSYVRGVPSPITQIGPNYRVFPHVETHQDFRPSLTSTPSCSRADPKENTQVRLSVKYPSKTLNRTLSGTYQNVGKAVAHGVPSRIATAVMNCPPVRNHVVEKVMKAVSKEVTGLCSKTKPSLLRKTGKEDLAKFDMENLCKEWRERHHYFTPFF